MKYSITIHKNDTIQKAAQQMMRLVNEGTLPESYRATIEKYLIRARILYGREEGTIGTEKIFYILSFFSK